MTSAQELRRKNDFELVSELAEKRETLRKARFDLAAGRVKNLRMIRDTRRSIARLLTIANERKSQ